MSVEQTIGKILSKPLLLLAPVLNGADIVVLGRHGHAIGAVNS